MSYNPNIHHRRSIRLKGYDYSKEGLYFITICVQDRACLFVEIVGASLVDALNTDNQPQNGQPQGFAPTNAHNETTAATMILNDSGLMIKTEWLALPKRFANIELHEFVVMPNHFHGILEIVVRATLVVAQNDNVIGRAQGHAPTNEKTNETTQTKMDGISYPADECKINKTVGDMMDAFKSITTDEYIRGVKTLGWQRFNGKLWQRNYHEHIIRNEQSYQRISEYIIDNPAKWTDDKFYNQAPNDMQ
jgi:putative transposase